MGKDFLFQCSACGSENYVSPEAARGRGRCARCGALFVPSNCLPQELTDATFKREVEGSTVPVVAYFWGPACGVCANYTLSVRKMAGEFCGKARVVMLNVEENPATPKAHGLKGVPSVLIFSGGKEVRALAGPQGVRGIAEILAQLPDWAQNR